MLIPKEDADWYGVPVFDMTEEMARQVQTWRCNDDADCTWRMIADLFEAKYKVGIIPGHQLHGMLMCRHASRILGVEVD